MNILFLEPQPCIRALKYATGLKNAGNHRITFGYLNKSLTEFYGTGDELFDHNIKLEKEGNEDLINLFNYENFDLIHSHNAPDYLTLKAIDALRYANRRIPIIQDNHDVLTMRKTPYSTSFSNIEKIATEEFLANRFSDARIHVTDGVKNYIVNMYGSKQNFDIIFNNFVPESMVPKKSLPKISKTQPGVHLVYEGNVDENKTGAHYDLLDIFDQITKQGFHLHVYTARDASNYKVLSQKNNLLHFHGRLEPNKLLTEISKYDFGWAGFNNSKNKEHLEVTLANKVMEYISAGLPVISFPHETQKRFLKSNKLGVIISSVADLSSALKGEDLKEIRANVMKRRKDFTIEKNIGKIEDFYLRIVESHKNK